PALVIVAVRIVVASALPTSVWLVSWSVHAIATPPEVSDVLGVPRVIVSASPSTSEAVIVPPAVVVSPSGSVSGTPFGKPSSDTATAAAPDVITGGGLVPVMVIVPSCVVKPPLLSATLTV